MDLTYLLAFPDPSEDNTPPVETFKGWKDAPYFQPVDIEVVNLGEETLVIEGFAVQVTRHRYDNRVQMIECRYSMKEPFADSAMKDRAKIQAALQSRFIPTDFRQRALFEEYSILLADDVKPNPDKWIEKNARDLARFIRSQRETFDPGEISEILSSRTRYSANELTLVDWEGAVIIAPEGDFQSDIALLKIGNYQLLRYRMLDESLETILDQINAEFLQNKKRPLRPGPTRATVRKIVQHRLEVMLDFERAEQNLLLIGDWYTAKLYEAIRSELYLEDWMSAVRAKLDNLERLISTIQENLSLTWSGLLENVQLAGWIILLVGYFILFFIQDLAP
ncbi:MAG: hypothetical protein HY867_06795 [Chloroflexi bacterium]|nr:hypothetical protein [Chloroflexota bacterium]